jgi:predicted NBD/HSP70 family sugar kinase
MTPRIPDPSLNRLAILKAIRRYAPVSRSELPTITRLSAGTITFVTSELIRLGLVVEERESMRRSGRPKKHLKINNEGAVMLGASIDSSKGLTTTFVDLSGNCIFEIDVRMRSPESLEALGTNIAFALNRAIAASPCAHESITRVGIALPGLIDSGRGTLHQMSTFSARPIALAESIAAAIDVPVTIEDDTVCMARAEHWFGRAQELDTFTLIRAEHAIGSAQYRDGVPVAGVNGFNAQLGHVKVGGFDADRGCYCGALGCVSAYGSIYGILRGLGQMGELPYPSLENFSALFNRVLDAADDGDPRALAQIALGARYLGLVIANHLNGSDPGHILVLVAGERWCDRVAELAMPVVAQNALPGILANSQVVFGQANDDWRRLGTAALALEKTYLNQGMRC